VLLVFLIAVPVSADPGTLYVDDDGLCGGNSPCYIQIQVAVNDAVASDTVYVYSGTYYEHVTINKSLTLQGENRGTTIVDGSGSGDVIYVTANNVTISGVTVTNGENGISLIANSEIHHVTIQDVIATSNAKRGISAMDSEPNYSYHVIEDCILSNNGGWGFKGNKFSRSIIRNCQVFGNKNGLAPGESAHTQIANNKVYENNNKGIYLNATWFSTVEQNEVWDNGGIGIGLGSNAGQNKIRDNVIRQNGTGMATKDYARGNVFYHNDLIGNTLQAENDCYYINTWDDGYPSGGNYWSDYTGSDDFSGSGQDIPGSDGIGDTPYEIKRGRDRYPLMMPSSTVRATVDIQPDTLNVKSKGKWVTAYIELPDGYDVADIDVSTVMLEGTIPAEDHPTKIGDYDDDGIPDLMVKFDRQALIDYLDGTTGEVTLTVSGELNDGTSFEGSDTVTVIN